MLCGAQGVADIVSLPYTLRSQEFSGNFLRDTRLHYIEQFVSSSSLPTSRTEFSDFFVSSTVNMIRVMPYLGCLLQTEELLEKVGDLTRPSQAAKLLELSVMQVAHRSMNTKNYWHQQALKGRTLHGLPLPGGKGKAELNSLTEKSKCENTIVPKCDILTLLVCGKR